MHPRTQELLAHLETQRASVRSAVEGIPADRLTHQPNDGTWSVAQVLWHLAEVERLTAGRLSGALERARADGLGPDEETSAVGGMLSVTRMLDRTRRLVRGGATTEPAATVTADEAWAALEASREAMRDVLHAADGLAVGEIVIPHPALGALNFYQWVLFVAGHEGRHAAQIREIAESL